MVLLPLSPIACALVTTFVLVVTFYTGSMVRNQNHDESNREGDGRTR